MGKEKFVMLLAEDDPDDQLLVREALEESKLQHELVIVDDGQALLDYLERFDSGTAPSGEARPDLIVLDLNLPRVDGRQVLERLKKSETLRRLPVVVLTTSKANEDVVRCYDLGVAGFITKPVTFDGLVEVLQSIDQYWFRMVQLPTE